MEEILIKYLLLPFPLTLGTFIYWRVKKTKKSFNLFLTIFALLTLPFILNLIWFLFE